MGLLSKILRNAEGGQLLFRCPGCAQVHGPAVGEGPGPRWSWNGSMYKPTFTPSILVQWTSHEPAVTPENLEQYHASPWPQTEVKNVCHSFVTNGRIHFLPDCTHGLAGKTVNIPEWVAQSIAPTAGEIS